MQALQQAIIMVRCHPIQTTLRDLCFYHRSHPVPSTSLLVSQLITPRPPHRIQTRSFTSLRTSNQPDSQHVRARAPSDSFCYGGQVVAALTASGALPVAAGSAACITLSLIQVALPHLAHIYAPSHAHAQLLHASVHARVNVSVCKLGSKPGVRALKVDVSIWTCAFGMARMWAQAFTRSA